MPGHDESYKLLFSHPEMVRDLIRGFIHEPWVAHIDFSTLEKIPDHIVSPRLKKFHQDIIYRVRLRDELLYIYLLLEFQSECDTMMAARMLNYTGQFYLSLLRQKVEFGGKLPPVLPIVLYNGKGNWTAPVEFSELVAKSPAGLERYQPSLRYLLIDERAVDESKSLAERNLVAALFRLEKSRGPEDLEAVVGLLIEWFKDAGQNELRDAFAEWIRQVLIPGKMPEEKISETTNISLKEIKHMLAETVKEWTQQWLQEGLEKGLEKGREEGLEKGLTQGEWIGKIQLLEKLMGRTQTERIALEKKSVKQLSAQFAKLEAAYHQIHRKS